jgi:ligand-binding sensor domain-containing protein
MKTIFNSSMIITGFVLCIFTGLTNQTAAKQNPTNLSQFIGLNEKVTAFAETERFYWIGTDNGVYQVKKKNKKVFHMTESNSQLPANMVTAICARSNGEVYIGTNKGILRYDRFTYIVMNNENANLKSNKITALYCDNLDQVWIGTSANSLSLIRNNSMKNYNMNSNEEMNDHIVGFEKDVQKALLIVMVSGTRMKLNGSHLVKTDVAEIADTK